MSFIPVTKKQLLSEGYTHHGKLWGIPVYIGDIHSEAPMVMAANFIPDWVLTVADFICFTILGYQNRDNPYYEPAFKIYVGKPIS